MTETYKQRIKRIAMELDPGHFESYGSMIDGTIHDGIPERKITRDPRRDDPRFQEKDDDTN